MDCEGFKKIKFDSLNPVIPPNPENNKKLVRIEVFINKIVKLSNEDTEKVNSQKGSNMLKVKTHKDLNLDLNSVGKKQENAMELKVKEFLRQKQDFIRVVIYLFMFLELFRKNQTYISSRSLQ